MDDYYQMFLDELGPQISKTQPSETQIEKFKKHLPAKLLEYWKYSGWGGFHNGLFWITNPDDYREAVEAWLNGTNIENKSDYFAIARSAFGRIFLWNKKAGQNVTIDSLSGRIITSLADKKVIAGDDTKAIQYFISGENADGLDFDDSEEKKLFKRALKKLGALKEDEMYGFEPALCVSGLPILKNLVKVKIIVHLILLEQLCDIEILHLDVSRHL